MEHYVFSSEVSELIELDQNPIDGIYPIRLNHEDVTICIRQDRDIIGYQFENSTRKWRQKWKENIFGNHGSFPSIQYPWLVSDKLLPKKPLVILRHPDGIRFYQLDLSKPGLKLLKEDGDFHVVYNYELLWGNFYYNSDFLGVMRRNTRGNIKFYAATPDSLGSAEPYPLLHFDRDLNLNPSWYSPETSFFTTNLLHNDQTVIGLRTKDGLEFQKFSKNYLLESVLNTSLTQKPPIIGHLFFADLTHEVYQDILHLNESGLFIYKYNKDMKDYAFLNYNVEFAHSRGWLPHYSDSVMLKDINKDGYDDLLFTDKRGLTALTFDAFTETWKTLLESNNLPSAQRYATILGIIPTVLEDVAHTSILTQNTDGKVNLLKVTQVLFSPNNITTATDVPELAETAPSSSDELQRIDIVPKQISRVAPSERPHRRWYDQWDDSFLKNAADAATGQVNLNIPLIDISSMTQEKIRLILSYNSQNTASDLVGEGWSLSLAQDYIFADYRGSIFPEDSRFYLIMQGQPYLLKRISIIGDTQYFKLSEQDENLKLVISYITSTQSWIVQGHKEKAIYGKANDPVAKDAFQWSLTWPNWRGLGRDSDQLQPIRTAWYLNKRETEEKEAMYYYYDEEFNKINGKNYTSSIRLKSINDIKEVQVTFDYKSKTRSEYDVNDPVNDGNIEFPVSLTKTHYLQGYKIITPTYIQSIEFIYKLRREKRLLTTIQQRVSSHVETLLEFHYQNVLERQILDHCKLIPRETTVRFRYKPVNPPSPTTMQNNLLKIPVKEKVRISTGQDYVVFGYIIDSTNTRITFQIMNRELTQTVKNYFINLISKIEDYDIQARQDTIMIFVEGSRNHIIYTLNRRKKCWSAEPVVYNFSKDALIRFSETVIAVSEPENNYISLYSRVDSNTDWILHNETISHKVRNLALHEQRVVVYDDNSIKLFYLDYQFLWQKRELKLIPDLFTMSTRTLKSFDLSAEISRNLSLHLKQGALQIFNNFILLSAWQELEGQLSLHINLFLLDSQHKVAEAHSVSIERENIYKISRETTSEDGTVIYTLGYVKEDGLFKVRAKHVSGKAFYQAQIIQNGVQCGNDTLFRITGTEWTTEPLSSSETINLGKHLILERSDDTKQIFKIYKQDHHKGKQGNPIKELRLDSSGMLINRYPAYLAYHSKPNVAEVITFKDGKFLDNHYTFSNEQLRPESDWTNLLTITNMTSGTGQECLVRPISTFISAKQQPLISQTILSDGIVERVTSFQRSYEINKHKQTFSEIVTAIPGGNKNEYGCYQTIRSYDLKSGNFTTTEDWFDANGEKMFRRSEQEQSQSKGETNNPLNPSLLLDASGNLIISDFTPYNLADEVAAYYGFEAYERNQISQTPGNTTSKSWRVNNAEIIKGHFPFTGEHYLQLHSKWKQQSFIEGTFNPHYQDITYLASCWIRSSAPLRINDPVNLFKAYISTNGYELIGLLAQIKYQLGDWFYLELPINFNQIKEIYRKFTETNDVTAGVLSKASLPLPENSSFTVTLRVEASFEEIVDVDHIRFSPISHDFEATVFHPVTGKPTAIIQANGLITRTIYNDLQQEIANIQEDEEVTSFSSMSGTGTLIPSPQITVNKMAKANSLTFEPQHGSYEIFDAYSFRNRWILENPAAWNIARGQLWHAHSKKDRMVAEKHLFDRSSAAVRIYFALQELKSCLKFHWNENRTLELIREQNDGKLILPDGNSIEPLPVNGELIIMLQENYIWIWLNGVLLLDKALPGSYSNPWSSFAIEAQRNVLIQDCFILNRPYVKIEYANAFGEKTQVIQLENTKTALVKATLYDKLGREAITTKTTRVHRSKNEPLLHYRSDFTTNKNPDCMASVWNTGKLLGEVDQLNPNDRGFAYIRTKYAPSPLNEESVLGLPGPEFSISGPYSVKFKQHSDIALLDNLFPNNQGFRQKAEYKPNGSCRVLVFDKNNNQIARYIRVPSYNHLLSTYEYDKENKLIKILPPLYHEKVDTFSKLTCYQSGEKHLSVQEEEWQHKLATFFSYDENGRLTRKQTPDSGTIEYLYNSSGQMRFMVSLDSKNRPTKAIYFYYDVNGQLVSTGHLTKPVSMLVLISHLESQTLPYAKAYQQFDHAYDHIDPLSRGRLKQYVTYNDGQAITEKLQFNARQQPIEKTTISLAGQMRHSDLTQIRREHITDKSHTLIYSIKKDQQPLHLVRTYNRLGQLTAIGTKDDPNYYASFTYYASGQLASEQYQSDFTRKYRYNSPGFLEEISDPFLTEKITYTDEGYGHSSYGDGMIMRTTFNASWPADADGRWFQLRENDLHSNYSQPCIQALKRHGYLNKYNKVIKLYVHGTEEIFPLVCGGETARKLAKLVAKKQVPTYYGHSYAYGNHQELVKAKYFTHDTEAFVKPLQSDSFATGIEGVTIEQSQRIWQLLTDAGYIINLQQRTDISSATGKRGKSYFRTSDLLNDLRNLNSDYILYVKAIEQLILKTLAQRKALSLGNFVEIFLQWENLDRESNLLRFNLQKRTANKIGQMLLDKGYLPTEKTFIQILDQKFTKILSQYSNILPDIVRVLQEHFAHDLGKTAFDMESYEIDANGNHRLFYTGFSRYELNYRNDTNQIQGIKLNGTDKLIGDQRYNMKHDAEGNVIQAMHKGIQHIEYHPVSQRVNKIILTDGRTLKFYYDAKGERILKRVFNSEGKMSTETYYLRDEKGRVLGDSVIRYLPEGRQRLVTAYLYGPRGLLGFIRNNQFYAVNTDHSGSVRLVIRDGKVVAAYDYLPYGQLMRSYGNDPEVHIMIRFTGQEWDEETGLYNYHARLYDPVIGRFYQPDPKAQYFSPYKYAGNSPISIVDPDGEFALLLSIIVCAVVGAYLGGAAANNRWNPIEWDYFDSGTYIGMIGGGIGGAMLPIVIPASVSAIGVAGTVAAGITTAYLSGASANQNWNLFKWKWDRPHTLNALFQGFGDGPGMISGVSIAHKFAKAGKALDTISKVFRVSRKSVKIGFLTVSYTAGAVTAFGFGVMSNDGNFAFWKWDWKNPNTLSSLSNGLDMGMGWPQNILEASRGIGKLIKNPKNFGSLLKKHPLKIKSLKAVLKNPNHPMYKTVFGVVMAYFMGSSANNEFDISRWNVENFSTYSGILNGAFLGKDVTNMFKLTQSNSNKTPSQPKPSSLNKIRKWSRKINNRLSDIQTIRTKAEYTKIMEQIFPSWQLKLEKFKNLPSTVIRDAKTFCKKGFKNWISGKTNPPAILHRIILRKAKKTVRESSKVLAEWDRQAEALSKKKQEVFPDRDIEFFNCGSRGRRKKRQLGGLTCSIPVPDPTEYKRKPELIERFLDSSDPGLPKDGNYKLIKPSARENPKFREGFSEYFSWFLEKIPADHAVSKEEFFPNAILGSLLTMPASTHQISKSVYAKIQTIEVPYKKTTHKILKTCFKKDANTLILKTFIVDKKDQLVKGNPETDNSYRQEVERHSRYNSAELKKMAKKLHIKGKNYNIEEHIFYINRDNTLHGKCSETNKATYLPEPEHTSIINKQKANFKSIKFMETTSIEDVRKDLTKLSSNNIEDVKSGIRDFSEKVLEIYKKNKDAFHFNEASEAEFHAFFFGTLSLNFQRQHGLGVYVERIAGRGYADLMILARKTENAKNWYAIPIVIEFKADTTPAKSAVDQTLGTGYLYNLSLRTLSKKAIVIGINARSSIDSIHVDVQDVPSYDGFINKVIGLDSDASMQDELKHLYFSISPLAIKTKRYTNDHYLSRLILGELLTNKDIKKLYLYDHKTGDYADKLVSYIFQKDNKWIMLNVIESSKLSGAKYVFDEVKINEFGTGINVDHRIDIKVNSRSKEGWSREYRKRTTEKEGSNENSYYFQEIKSYHGKSDEFVIPENYQHVGSINVGEEPIVNSFFYGKQEIEKALKEVSKSLESATGTINSESDFQAVVQGLFTGNHKTVLSDGTIQIIKVFPEVNLSRAGRIDLVISSLREQKNINGEKIVSEDALIVMELKYTAKSSEVKRKLREAMEQLEKYKNNLNSVTDLAIFYPIAIVFDQSTGNIKYDIHLPDEVTHTTPELSPTASRIEVDSPDFNRITQSGEKLEMVETELFINRESLKRGREDDSIEHNPEKSKKPRISSTKDDVNDRITQSGEKLEMVETELSINRESLKRGREDDPIEHNPEKSKKPRISSTKDDVNELASEVDELLTLKRQGRSLTDAYNPEEQSIKNNTFKNFVSSGSNKQQFWFANLAKKLKTSFSFLFSFGATSPMIETIHAPPSSKLFEPNKNTEQESSTILEMGDQWLNNTDINGLLIWGTLLTRKWTGYRDKPTKTTSYDDSLDIELDIRSTALVDDFIDAIVCHSNTCGINLIVSEILEDGQLYFKCIKAVRQKLTIGALDTIPNLLYKQLVQENISKISLGSNQTETNEFLKKLIDCLPKFQEKVYEQEEERLSKRQQSGRFGVSNPILDSEGSENNIFQQAIPDNQQFQQLYQEDASTSGHINSIVDHNISG